MDEWFLFHSRDLEADIPGLFETKVVHGYPMRVASKAELRWQKTFWEIYRISLEDRGRIIPILQRTCLDCFDIAWQSAIRPGYTYDTVNDRVSELCARALRGGKRAPKFDVGPLSLEHASLLAEWRVDEPKRKLHAVAEHVLDADVLHRFVTYHVGDHSNRQLSLSGEPPAFLHEYRTTYRHARKLAGVQGYICSPKLDTICDEEALNRFGRAGVIFKHEMWVARRVHQEVKLQLNALSTHGDFAEGCVGGGSYLWESNFASQILFEQKQVQKHREAPPRYKSRSRRPCEEVIIKTSDGSLMGMLNPNVVPLASRLAYFKNRRRAWHQGEYFAKVA